jgi:hypothetical protein
MQPPSPTFRPDRPRRDGSLASGLHGWSRRVLPPGPMGLLRRPFIAIAALAGRHAQYRRARVKKKGGLVRRSPEGAKVDVSREINPTSRDLSPPSQRRPCGADRRRGPGERAAMTRARPANAHDAMRARLSLTHSKNTVRNAPNTAASSGETTRRSGSKCEPRGRCFAAGEKTPKRAALCG